MYNIHLALVELQFLLQGLTDPETQTNQNRIIRQSHVINQNDITVT